jgi:hypothetical protein
LSEYGGRFGTQKLCYGEIYGETFNLSPNHP